MAEVHEIDAEFSQLYGIVKFRGNEQNYFLISASKAKSNAKVLRQAADLITGSTEQAKNTIEWLTDLAGKFERCEGE